MERIHRKLSIIDFERTRRVGDVDMFIEDDIEEEDEDRETDRDFLSEIINKLIDEMNKSEIKTRISHILRTIDSDKFWDNLSLPLVKLKNIRVEIPELNVYYNGG